MKFEAQRDDLLKALQAVIGVVEKRQTMPVLSNFLLSVAGKELTIVGTDLELELLCRCPVSGSVDGAVTTPARKLFDICRGLPDGSKLSFELKDGKMLVKSGRGRFTLSTLPKEDFPVVDAIDGGQRFSIPRQELRMLIDKTQFAMAHQDVRYYLNGLLIVVRHDRLRAVATDGHRLALSDSFQEYEIDEELQVIVPRKAITELQRSLDDSEDPVELIITDNHLQLSLDPTPIRFTTKLIDGRFPDYERVIPDVGDMRLAANRDLVRQALVRTAILSNEKFRGVRVGMEAGKMTLQTQNPDHEEAVEELEVEFSGDEMEIGFNVNYLLDVLGVIEADEFIMTLNGPDSSGLITEPDNDRSRYVIMPMRL